MFLFLYIIILQWYVAYLVVIGYRDTSFRFLVAENQNPTADKVHICMTWYFSSVVLDAVLLRIKKVENIGGGRMVQLVSARGPELDPR